MKKFFGAIILAVVFVGSPALLNADSGSDGISGTYSGQVFSGGQFLPMEMTIRENLSGGIFGNYVMKEEGGDETGNLRLESQVDDDVYIFSWIDKYGNGRLKVLFSGDKNDFLGFWNSGEEPLIYMWTGSKNAEGEK